MSQPAPRRPVVAVPRATEQAGPLTERLRAAGCDVVEVPVVEVLPAADGGAALAAALADLDAYDWVVVTSPNGAARVGPALRARAADRRPLVAAVGPGTAAALGVDVDLVPSRNIGEGLVEAFPPGTGRVLLAQAEAARPVVALGLAGLGWHVDAVVAYRTVSRRLPQTAVRALMSADAVVVTSGSTVRNLVAVAGRHGLPDVVVSIGPATSAVARDLGLTVAATAEPHTLEGLVAAVTRVLGLGPTPGG
jgi:uroporphyrinogen-III synthase